MSISPPSVRKDLSISRQETAEGLFFVIKVPETGLFYRFGETEFFIIQQLDGLNSLKKIRENIAAKFGSPLGEATLQGFISGLGKRGLLLDGNSLENLAAYQKRRVKGTWLLLRISAFDPDSMLELLVKKLGFIFTPLFLTVSTALILFSCMIMGANSIEIETEIANNLDVDSLLIAWVVILLISITHEFAHGLTCKYFGGKVHEMGFLLLYFMPALFCNISDAWLFPKKSQRLWVAFAGAYCELLIWAFAVIFWRITAPETLFNYLALIIVSTSGIRILFNFNPLIKLDGYYMLSDFLDIPNLRIRAFRYLGTRIKSLFTSKNLRPPDMTNTRERKIYLIYGLFAGAFSALFLGYAMSLLGGFLIENFQGPGFLLLTVVLMLIFKRSLTGFLGSIKRSLSNVRKPQNFPTRKLLALTSFFSLLFLIELNLTVSGEFEVYPDHNADVRSKVDAIIEEIYVDEGEWVEAGDPIARLSDLDLRSELSKIEARLQEQRANLKLILKGPSEEDIALAQGEIEQAEVHYQHTLMRTQEAEKMHANQLVMLQNEIEKAQMQLDFAKKKRDRYQILAEKKLVPEIKLEEVNEETTIRQKEFKEAETEWKIALANVNAETRKELAASESEIKLAKAKLNLLLAGSRTEEIEAAQALISGLESEKIHLQNQLQLVAVSSPISGVVTTPKPKEKVGQKIEKGELILEVYDTHVVQVETRVPEKEIGDVQIGQQVILKARAYPNESFSGTVKSIAPVVMEDEDRINSNVVRVITEIDNKALLLKPLMTGHSKIYCGKRSIIDLITRRLVSYLRVEFWSWW